MSPPSANAKRLVILGCGYVGSAVVPLALARGWHVAALTRNADTAQLLRASGVDVVVADLAASEWHAQIDPRVDCILNTVSSAGGGLPGYWHSYVQGTESVLRWAQEATAATYVYTGSTSVYPQHQGEIVDEDAPTGGGAESSAALLQAEELIRSTSCFAGWFILRLAGLYGPGRHYLLDQLRAGATEFPGAGTHRLNLAHRDDVVAAIMACFDAPRDVRDQIFNVAGDTAVPKVEVAAWLAGQIGVPPPRFVGDDGGQAVDVTTRVRGRSGPVPDRVISNQRLKDTLGWHPQYPDFRVGYRAIFSREKTTPESP